MIEGKSDNNESYDLSIDKNTRYLKKRYYEGFGYVPSKVELRLNKNQYTNALDSAIKEKEAIVYRRHKRIGDINSSNKI